MHEGSLYEKTVNGMDIVVYPLIMGTARIVVSEYGSDFIDNGW